MHDNNNGMNLGSLKLRSSGVKPKTDGELKNGQT
jgi:hypothetical protein